MFPGVTQRHCLTSLCIFSFILCSRSFSPVKMRTTQLKSFAIVWLLRKKGREKKSKGIQHEREKKRRTCDSSGTGLILFLIFSNKWAFTAFSQMSSLLKPCNDNLGLWTCLFPLSAERVWSILFRDDTDKHWKGKGQDRRIRVGRKKNTQTDCRIAVRLTQPLVDAHNEPSY